MIVEGIQCADVVNVGGSRVRQISGGVLFVVDVRRMLMARMRCFVLLVYGECS